MTPTLVTDRLRLRPLRADDAPALQRHFGRWEIIRHLARAVPWPYPDDGAERFLQDLALPSMAAREGFFWAITERDGDDELIGVIEVRVGSDRDSRGFWLAVPHQGQGYMTEAITAVQDHLFFEAGVERLLVLNSVENVRSRRVKEKTGARLLGEIEMPHHDGGTRTQQWEITAEAWARLRGHHPPGA